MTGDSDDTPRGNERALLIALAAAINLGSIAVIVIAPFFPEIAEDWGTSVSLVGQVAAAGPLVGAVLGLLIGPLADAVGHRRVMVAGPVAAGVTPLGIGPAPSYPLLLLTAIPGGLAAATLTGLTLAVAGSAFEGQARHRAIGRVSGVRAATGIVAIPLATALGPTIGWQAVFIAYGLVAIVPVARSLPAVVAHRSAPGVRAMLEGYAPLPRDGSTARLYLVIALCAVCWGAMVTYSGAFLKDEARFSGGQVGLAYFLSSILFFLACIAAGRVRQGTPRHRAAVGDVGLAIVVGLLYAAPLSTVPLLLVCAVSGASGAFGYVGVSGMLAELAADRQTGAGITMSLGTALVSLGCATGGAAGGGLIALGGYGLLGLVAPIFALIGAVLLVSRSGDGTEPVPAAHGGAARAGVGLNPGPTQDAL